ENLEITMGQLRNAIESYINDTNASQIMTWPAYYRSSIYSAVRRRIGQAGMASLNEFFENKKAEKVRNSILETIEITLWALSVWWRSYCRGTHGGQPN